MEGLGHQPLDPLAGIETAVGILKDDLHIGPRGARHFGADRMTAKPDRAALQRIEAKDRPRQRRLPAAGFADKTKGLARAQGEADPIDRAQFRVRGKG